MRKISLILSLGMLIVFTILIVKNAQADIIIPAAFNQFAISTIVPTYYSYVVGISILLVESFFIRRYWIIRWPWAFLSSFIINFTSSVLGILIMRYLYTMLRSVLKAYFLNPSMKLELYASLFPGYLITVVVEWLMILGFVYSFQRNYETRKLFNLSARMNFFSYMILLVAIALTDL